MRYLFPHILKLSTNNEGGYSNHPKDPGGPTNHGITLATLRAYRGGRMTTADDVKRLTLAEADKIYEANYWKPIFGDQLPAGLDYSVFDFGINAGISRAVRELQGLLPGVAIDGIMGMKTLTAIRAFDPRELVKGLNSRRIKFYKKLKTFKTFGRGWVYRVTGVDPLHKYPVRPGVIGDSLAMIQQKAISLVTMPNDPEMPLAKGRDVDIKIFAPVGNKIQGAIAGLGAGGLSLSTLTNMLPSFTQAQGMLEPYKDTAKVIGYVFTALVILCAVLTILHNAQKSREPGIDT